MDALAVAGDDRSSTILLHLDIDNLEPWRRGKYFLRLIKGIQKWPKTRNAERLSLHVTTAQKMAPTDKLLKAAGMQMVGGGYVG